MSEDYRKKGDDFAENQDDLGDGGVSGDEGEQIDNDDDRPTWIPVGNEMSFFNLPRGSSDYPLIEVSTETDLGDFDHVMADEEGDIEKVSRELTDEVGEAIEATVESMKGGDFLSVEIRTHDDISRLRAEFGDMGLIAVEREESVDQEPERAESEVVVPEAEEIVPEAEEIVQSEVEADLEKDNVSGTEAKKASVPEMDFGDLFDEEKPTDVSENDGNIMGAGEDEITFSREEGGQDDANTLTEGTEMNDPFGTPPPLGEGSSGLEHSFSRMLTVPPPATQREQILEVWEAQLAGATDKLRAAEHTKRALDEAIDAFLRQNEYADSDMVALIAKGEMEKVGRILRVHQGFSEEAAMALLSCVGGLKMFFENIESFSDLGTNVAEELAGRELSFDQLCVVLGSLRSGRRIFVFFGSEQAEFFVSVFLDKVDAVARNLRKKYGG